MNTFKWTIVFAIGIMSYATAQNAQDIDTSSNEIKVLFIGNSLTYFNDLPNLVKIAAKKKGVSLKVKMIANPNYALIDHLNDGVVQKELSTNNYRFLIVQQGPSSQLDGKTSLIEEGKKFRDLCKKNNTKLCFFMVWPSLSNYHTFNGVIRNYTEAATVNNAILLPIGEIWKSYVDSTNSYDYYSSDGFHPSLKGSEVTADVIVQYLLKNL